MRTTYLFAAAAGLVVAVGCTQRRPGYCESNSECMTGQHCQLGPSVDKFMCVANSDGGPDADGGVDSDGGGGCQTSGQCPSSGPICLAGTCSSCAGADAGACAMRDSMHPVCSAAGLCIECSASADCSGSKPICDATANTCGPCTSDAQCAGKGIGPGICMSHQDGRCATDAETVYVQFTAPCNVSPSGGNGTAGSPFCNLAPAVMTLPPTAKLIVIVGGVGGSGFSVQGASIGTAQLSFIGQAMAVITPPGGNTVNLTVDGANVYMRNVTVKGSLDIGLSVKNNATVQLDTVTFDSNAKGGLLIDNSSFNVRNCTFTNNGPGNVMGFSWGGVRVQGTTPSTKTLANLTIVGNKDIGLSCAWAVDNAGIYASGNMAGMEVSPTCG